MLRIDVTEDPREGQEAFQSFNLPRYSRSLFGMYGGEETRVTLEAENALIGIFIDRFGKEMPVIPTDEGHFKTMLSIAVSPQFFGWLMALSDRVRILGPESVVQSIKEMSGKITRLYE